MEKNDDSDVQLASPKIKSKKRSLCRILLQKKTKIGCSSEDSDTSSDSDRKKHLAGNNSSLDNHCTKDETCEYSESSSEFEERINVSSNEGITEMNKQYYTVKQNMFCETNMESPGKPFLEGATPQSGKHSVKAASFEDKVDNSFHKLEEKLSGSLPNSCPFSSKSFNSSVFHSSLSPSTSETSCDTLPLQFGHSQAKLRERLFSKRRSVDNIITSFSVSSLRHSSPVSCRSAPDPQKYKTRSASQDTMLPPKDNDKKKSSISSSSSEVNLSGKNSTGAKSKGVVASMDSLARHSLLAAQVLHLIPTIKARERNFLYGRIAANSLLGSVELERTLPHRELRLFIGTWNMNGQAPPQELNDFMLPAALEHVPDVIAVGTQESYSERFEWEVSIQETLGPSHLMLHSAALGTLHLAVFIRRDLLWFCSIAEEASYSVRPGTAFRTKGAVAIAFMVFGTSYLFITSHLTAHQEKVKERVHDIKKIIRSLDLPKVLPVRHKNKDVTQNFDYVFWFGDLNFRLLQPREEVLQWVSEQEFPLPLPHSLHSDQLKTIINEGSVFRDFEEGPITFPPTYKYDVGSQKFDSSNKQRTPSYTDRILFKCRGRGTSCGVLECLLYSSVPSICTSDHKPVWGLYSSAVRPGIDTIPLAAGLFNREVYLEGIKRRAAAMDRSQGTSAICSLQ